MEKAYLYTKIKISILGTGKIIRLMEQALFIIIKEWYIQGNGKMMKCTEKENKNGLMEPFLLDILKKELKLKDVLFGPMVTLIKVAF